jgi:hypothetical protein
MTPITSISALDDIGSNVNVTFVPLAWNFFSEIRSKIKKHRDVQDDCFLRYFPAVEIGH